MYDHWLTHGFAGGRGLVKSKSLLSDITCVWTQHCAPGWGPLHLRPIHPWPQPASQATTPSPHLL